MVSPNAVDPPATIGGEAVPVSGLVQRPDLLLPLGQLGDLTRLASADRARRRCATIRRASGCAPPSIGS